MLKKVATLCFLACMLITCQNHEEIPTEEVNTFGILDMKINISIEEDLGGARTNSVDIGTFAVEIFDLSDNLIVSFDPLSSAPAQIELPVGQYYLTATNNLENSAFESPHYFGSSEHFTISEAESKSVDVTVALGNSIVVISYSDNVTNTFSNYTSSVTVKFESTESTLNYSQGETRPGYFISGYPLEVEVDLGYVDGNGADQTKKFVATIEEGAPKTQYNVNVDAELVNGQIQINTTVDEEVEEIDVEIIEYRQSLWDEIARLEDIDMGFSTIRSSDDEGGVYNSTARITEATGDVVSWKGFGTNPWSVPNLEPFSYDNPLDFDLWYSNEGAYPQLVDRGDLDKYLRIRNGVSIQYATQPGSISPAQTLPLDIVWVMRLYPNPGNETDGLLRYQNLATNWQIAFNASNYQNLNTSGGLYNRVYCRFTCDASGSWEFRLNDLDKVTPDAVGTGYNLSFTEFWFGSNGHPAETHHWTRLINQQIGGFSQASLDLMQSNFETLWPLGKPDFPLDDGAHDVSFNSSTNIWSVDQGSFTGGNGVRGTFEYQWYYWNRADDTTFPIGNKLDEHLPIQEATSNSLDRDDYLGVGQPWENVIPGSGDIWVMCVVTPTDSDGMMGEKIVTEWVLDNTD